MADKPEDGSAAPQITRRSFIKGAGAAAAMAGLAGLTAPAKADAAPAEPGVKERLGPGPQTIQLTINGRAETLAVEPRVTLLRALREHLGLTGTKLVCDRGACGACTVHLDRAPVTSCMVLAIDARGHQITTIEGLGAPGRMHPVQSAFVQDDALQCGFCTPGMVMSIAAELERNSRASLEDFKRAAAGNTCRCGTYPNVFRAALRAAGASTAERT